MSTGASGPGDDLISISAAAAAIGINKSTLSRQVKAGQVRCHGGKLRLSEVREDRAKIGLSCGRDPAAPTKGPAANFKPLHDAVAPIMQRATRRTDATPPVDGQELISLSAAAKAIGVNKSTIKRQVDSGAIRSHGGKVRLAEVLEDRAKNINLGKSRKRGSPKNAAAPDDADGDDIEQLEMVLVDGQLLPFAKAQALKENYLALLRQLEWLSKSGALVDRQAAETLFFQVAREFRDAWTGWPARVATLMASELRIEDRTLAETLTRYVQQHLGELGEPNSPTFMGTDGKPSRRMATGSDAGAAANGAGVGRVQ